jgi:hypothetical protein
MFKFKYALVIGFTMFVFASQANNNMKTPKYFDGVSLIHNVFHNKKVVTNMVVQGTSGNGFVTFSWTPPLPGLSYVVVIGTSTTLFYSSLCYSGTSITLPNLCKRGQGPSLKADISTWGACNSNQPWFYGEAYATPQCMGGL